MRCCTLLLPAILLMFPVGATAKNVPVEIYWSGLEPSQVLLNVPGGLQPLGADRTSHKFYGILTFSGKSPQRHTIVLRYGRYNHPFDIQIQPFLKRVTFAVAHTKLNSCTAVRVDEAGRPSDNLPDAVNRAINAGQLLDISEPNACDRDLRFGAIQARYRQNAKMNQLSNGFFLINADVEREYRQEARVRGLNVDRELAAYALQERASEARQLIAFSAAAKGTRNYSVAIHVNEYIAARLETNSAAAAAYRSQGVTGASLAADTQYLEALSTRAAATGTIDIEPNQPKNDSPPQPR